MAGDLAIRRLNWALLIDGENIGAGFADEILRLATARGALPIRQVYGDAGRLAGWAEVGGLRLVHAGAGKNATDLLVCIAAMEIFHTRQAEGIVLAASDRDYTHLALHLRERGFRLVVLGEAKTPERLCQAAAEFVLLGKATTPKPVAKTAKAALIKSVPKPGPEVAAKGALLPKAMPFDPQLRETIAELAPAAGWAPIGPLGTAMWQRHQIKRKDTGCATWGKYLAGRSDICQTDSATKPQKVRLFD